MAIINGYCTLDDFKKFITASGHSLNADDIDDLVIEDIIERASRKFDGLCGRHFYPRVDTRYYSVPDDDILWLDDDLLAVTTLTNGDANTIASTNYHLLPRRISR